MKLFLLLVFVSLVVSQSAFPNGPTYNGRSMLYKSFSLPYTRYAEFNPLLPFLNTNNISAPFEGYPSFSADLNAVGDGTFYAISNRGPFTACGANGEYLPFPQLSPTAIRFSFNFTEPTSTGLISVLPNSYYWLRANDADYSTTASTGLSPSVNYFNDSKCTTPTSFNLGFTKFIRDGIDPGAFAVMRKKQFYVIGEGNAPSILITDTTGKFRQRYVPAQASFKAAQTSSLFSQIIPGVFSSTRSTRDIGGGSGFGGIAITQDEKTLWAILRRPLGSDAPNSPTLNANLHRVLRLDISDPLNAVVSGVFFYQTSPLSEWQAQDQATQQTDIKVTGLAKLDDNRFLVLERGRSNSKVFVVDFSQASDVKSNDEANYIPVLVNEQKSHNGKQIKWTLPTKAKILDLAETGLNATTVAEGLAIVTPSVIALTSDNGWSNSPFQIHAIQLGKALPLPVAAQTPNKYFETGPRGGATAAAPAASFGSATAAAAAAAASAAPTAQPIPQTFTLNFNFGGIVPN